MVTTSGCCAKTGEVLLPGGKVVLLATGNMGRKASWKMLVARLRVTEAALNCVVAETGEYDMVDGEVLSPECDSDENQNPHFPEKLRWLIVTRAKTVCCWSAGIRSRRR